MNRFKGLTLLGKGLLILAAVMAVVFAPLYAVTTARTGILYRDAILVPRTEGGSTVYEGKVNGARAVFTVTEDKTVTFRWGEREYGPYTAVKDPTAVPSEEQSNLAGYMTGVEIRCGEEVFFRGGVFGSGEDLLLFREDGSLENFGIYASMEDGTVVDGDGNPVDTMAPGAGTILRLMAGPELTHKGSWVWYVLGLAVSGVLAVSILFADELFRFGLFFRIRDAGAAEPSDWELMGRVLGWVTLAGMAAVVYIMGLTWTP